jgi:phosphoribosyl 1,2-cyclic phosphate phosphodiesterase
MRVHILGTAAAEGWPAVFCGCDTCRRARAAGGKDLRTRSSVQIDDDYKIDLPPDTFHHILRHNLDLSALKYLFVTHTHTDHFARHELEFILPGFSHGLSNGPLRIWGNEAVVERLQWLARRPDAPVTVSPAEPFVPITADHLTFTPILAEHAPPEQCLNYVVNSETAAVLYACDTGMYGKTTMEHLAAYRFDLMIVECTFGDTNHRPIHHMTFAGVLQLRDRLAKAHAVDSRTEIVITHFSHNMGRLHDEMVSIAAPEGVIVAYDGMTLETA